MKLFSIFTLAGIASVAAVAPKPDEVSLAYSYKQYLSDFGKTYSAAGEKIFLANLERIVSHNKQKSTYKLGVNIFTDLDAKELASYRGLDKMALRASRRDVPVHPTPSVMETSEYPSELNWSNIMPPPMNQGSCGSCWIFASTATAAAHLTKQTGTGYILSTQQGVDCIPNPDSCGGTGGCYGGTAQVAFDYFIDAKAGWWHEYAYPYLSYYNSNNPQTFDCRAVPGSSDEAKQAQLSIDGYVNVANNSYWALLSAVQQGPVVVNVDASNLHGYAGGVLPACEGTLDLNHAVTLIGYGTDENAGPYWLIRNSWSPTWGEGGNYRIARQAPDAQPCLMDYTPQDGTACAGQTDPVEMCGSCGLLYMAAYPVVSPFSA